MNIDQVDLLHCKTDNISKLHDIIKYHPHSEGYILISNSFLSKFPAYSGSQIYLRWRTYKRCTEINEWFWSKFYSKGESSIPARNLLSNLTLVKSSFRLKNQSHTNPDDNDVNETCVCARVCVMLKQEWISSQDWWGQGVIMAPRSGSWFVDKLQQWKPLEGLLKHATVQDL